MKRPTWATVVGILGIIFGCLGILGGGQEVMMPKIMKFQKGIFNEIVKSSNTDRSKNTDKSRMDSQETKNEHPEVPPDIFKSIQKMWEFPEWFQTWSIFSGITKALISALYLYSSILILQIKPTGIRLFYWAAGSSILLNILRGAVTALASAFMGIAMMFGGVFRAIIDIILIVVVATGNKEAFYQPPPPLNV